jgi:hypothetical protein
MSTTAGFICIESIPNKILGHPVGTGLDLKALQNDVARHHLVRTLREAGVNKSKAAELVGLPNYLTLTNWLPRYGVDDGTTFTEDFWPRVKAKVASLLSP